MAKIRVKYGPAKQAALEGVPGIIKEIVKNDLTAPPFKGRVAFAWRTHDPKHIPPIVIRVSVELYKNHKPPLATLGLSDDMIYLFKGNKFNATSLDGKIHGAAFAIYIGDPKLHLKLRKHLKDWALALLDERVAYQLESAEAHRRAADKAEKRYHELVNTIVEPAKDRIKAIWNEFTL